MGSYWTKADKSQRNGSVYNQKGRSAPKCNVHNIGFGRGGGFSQEKGNYGWTKKKPKIVVRNNQEYGKKKSTSNGGDYHGKDIGKGAGGKKNGGTGPKKKKAEAGQETWTVRDSFSRTRKKEKKTRKRRERRKKTWGVGKFTWRGIKDASNMTWALRGI